MHSAAWWSILRAILYAILGRYGITGQKELTLSADVEFIKLNKISCEDEFSFDLRSGELAYGQAEVCDLSAMKICVEK